MGILDTVACAPSKLHYQSHSDVTYEETHDVLCLHMWWRSALFSGNHQFFCCQSKAARGCLCGVQAQICLKKKKKKSMHTIRVQNPSRLALYAHIHPPAKRAGAVWVTLLWKHSGEVGGRRHSTLQKNKCLEVGFVSSTHIRARTQTPIHIYKHTKPSSSNTSRPHHTCIHTEHFLTRNIAACPEETLELLCFWFPSSHGGGGGGVGRGELVAGQDVDTLWKDFGGQDWGK